MRSQLSAALLAGTAAIVLNTLVLKLADLISLRTAHGGLLRLIAPWFAGPLNRLGVAALWQHARGPSPSSSLFQTGFHLAVGMGMAVIYGFVVQPPLGRRAIVNALIYGAAVWIVNAAIVLPLTGEGFAGNEHLKLAGMVWFAAAHMLFFIVLALLYKALRDPPQGAKVCSAIR